MSKKNKKKKKERKRLAGCEHKSERRTAEFAVGQLDSVQDQLGDLIPELRMFEQYNELMMLSFNMALLERLKKKLRKFVDNGVWEHGD